MGPGDLITATWPDGSKVVGIYARSERGYVVILDLQKNKEVNCNMRTVKLEPGNQNKIYDADKIVRTIQLTVAFIWGCLLGACLYWIAI